jgi:hypothetical protein
LGRTNSCTSSSAYHKQAEDGGGKIVAAEGVTIVGNSASPEQEAYGLERSRVQSVSAMAQNNPEEALRLSQTINDPALRSSALAYIATAIGTTTPDLAKEIEKNIADTLPGIKDADDRLSAMVALAEAAAAGYSIKRSA